MLFFKPPLQRLISLKNTLMEHMEQILLMTLHKQKNND